ncbi:MAG TPA: tRNA pseudouridine(55) synthase TruB [Melioribacteraceae bacterium]|nr:tRNA pseudouridine(55) synthase TruB [Melioribacteraceae bacterium]
MITKSAINNYEPDFEAGEIILIDKSLFKSSFDIVYKVRKAINVKKVGHAGTLDPMATGLLIVCTGKKTKEISEFRGLDKTYAGTFCLGKTTPSFDMETEFDSESGIEGVTAEKVIEFASAFIGKSFQIPPIYSAVKHNGKSLYQFARKGVEIIKEPREIFISSFKITGIELPDVYFEITCSSGTYIRVIANDFGKKIGCGAYLKKLRRTKIGDYNVDEALTISEFTDKYKERAMALQN